MEFDEDETSLLIQKSPRPKNKWNIRKFCNKNLAMCLIIISLACERSSYYIVDCQLALALKSHPKLHWNPENTRTAYNLFVGFNLLAMFVFAFLSDIKLGRIKTLMIGFPIHLIGMILMTLTVTTDSSICNYDFYTVTSVLNSSQVKLSDDVCVNLIIPIVIIMAVGSGAIRACLVVFGADQIQNSKITSRYFDLCVIVFNIGSIVETSLDDLIRMDQNRPFTIFLTATCLLSAAYLLFLIGWRSYTFVETYDSVLYYCIPVIKNAYQTKRRYNKKRYRLALESSFTTISHTNVEQEIEEIMKTNRRKPNLLDMARLSNRGKYRDAIVDDVKSLRTAFILFILIFPYKIIFSQLFTVLQTQVTQMSNTTTTPLLLTFADNTEPITVIISILFLNIFFYKLIHGSNRFFTTTTKFIFSMFFAIVAMCLAAIIEIVRQQECPTDGLSDASNLTVFVHIPEDVTIGIAQMFNLLASFEFAYFVAPRSAQCIFMTFHSSSVIAASYAGVAFDTLLASQKHPIDFTCSSAHRYGWIYPSYFVLFAIIQLIFMILFLICDSRLRITRYNPQQMEMHQLH